MAARYAWQCLTGVDARGGETTPVRYFPTSRAAVVPNLRALREAKSEGTTRLQARMRESRRPSVISVPLWFISLARRC